MGSNTNTFLKDKRSGQEVKGLAKPKDVIYDTQGQWKYPGQVTKIPSSNITMQGVPYPVYGEDDLGYGQMMYPGMDYTFPGQYVTETPVAMYGGDPSLPNITGHYKTGGWLDEYAPGGEGPPSTLDIIKRRKQEQAIAEEAARRKGMIALPDITRVNVPDKKAVESKIKNEGKYVEVKDKKIPIKPQPQLNRSYKTEEQTKADEARGNYIENPTFMDYLGQAGYMPLLAMSDPFSMGENLKSLRQSQSDPRLSAAQKFSQGMDIANEAVPGALLNVATEGIGEGLLPGVVNKFTKAPQMMKNLYKDIPLAPTAPGANAEPISMVMPSKEKIKDLYGFLDRRRFLKELQKEGLVGNEFNIGDINYAAGSTDKTNALTKLALQNRRTGYRGVSGKLPFKGKGIQDATSRQFDMSQPIKAGYKSEFENMIDAGVNFKDPKSIAQYQATHVPMQDYGYRSGVQDMSAATALFASDRPYIGSGGGYGDYQFKVIPKTDFSEGNYLDWYNKYYKDVPVMLAKTGQKGLSDEFKRMYGKPNFAGIPELQEPFYFNKSHRDPTFVGPRGSKIYDIDPEFLQFSEYKNLGIDQRKALEEYVNRANRLYNTGWRGEYKTGGWLDEEYKRGGALKKLSKNTTSKNIKTSVNKLMARNTTLYGDGGKKYYEPNVKPYLKTGGWLDDVK